MSVFKYIGNPNDLSLCPLHLHRVGGVGVVCYDGSCHGKVRGKCPFKKEFMNHDFPQSVAGSPMQYVHDGFENDFIAIKDHIVDMRMAVMHAIPQVADPQDKELLRDLVNNHTIVPREDIWDIYRTVRGW